MSSSPFNPVTMETHSNKNYKKTKHGYQRVWFGDHVPSRRNANVTQDVGGFWLPELEDMMTVPGMGSWSQETQCVCYGTCFVDRELTMKLFYEFIYFTS